MASFRKKLITKTCIPSISSICDFVFLKLLIFLLLCLQSISFRLISISFFIVIYAFFSSFNFFKSLLFFFLSLFPPSFYLFGKFLKRIVNCHFVIPFHLQSRLFFPFRKFLPSISISSLSSSFITRARGSADLRQLTLITRGGGSCGYETTSAKK